MEMKWIPISEAFPEDEQPVVYLTAGGYSGIEVFYQIIFNTEYGSEYPYATLGPAGHWGSGVHERLYWFPLPSFYGIPGVAAVDDYYIQRELKEDKNNDVA